MSNNDENALDVLLTENQMLRDQLTKGRDNELKILSIVVTAYAVIYGIIFSNGVFDLVYVIPLIIIPLAQKFRYETYAVMLMGDYIIKLEKKTSSLIKDPDYLGWQHYWNRYNDEKVKLFRDIIPKMLIFVYIPIFFAFFYSLLEFSGKTNYSIIPENLNFLHGIFAGIYLFVMVMFPICYFLKRDQ